MKLPGDDEPEPEGGRAAERMREFLRERLPQEPTNDLDQAPGGEDSGAPKPEANKTDK